MKSFNEMVAEIVANAKTDKWLNGAYAIEYEGKAYYIGVKAYGKWVQRIQCGDRYASTTEQKTLKAFKAEVTNELEHLLKCSQGATIRAI